MTALLRRLSLALLLALPLVMATQAHARTADAEALGGGELARELAVRLDRLRVDVTMMAYDESVTAYSDAARDGFNGMSALAEKFGGELAQRDAAAAQAFATNWKTTGDALLGGGEFSEGIITLGYDAAQHAYFGDSTQQGAAVIATAWPLQEASEEALAARLVARALANYILAAASPFGSYTASYNAGDAEDPEVMVPRVTAALESLREKYRQDAPREALISDALVKWRFIRSALLVAGQKSMPTIVYRHGNDILTSLQTLP
jgi:hypothetical protein